jgi:hypothetical protein
MHSLALAANAFTVNPTGAARATKEADDKPGAGRTRRAKKEAREGAEYSETADTSAAKAPKWRVLTAPLSPDRSRSLSLSLACTAASVRAGRSPKRRARRIRPSEAGTACSSQAATSSLVKYHGMHLSRSGRPLSAGLTRGTAEARRRRQSGGQGGQGTAARDAQGVEPG